MSYASVWTRKGISSTPVANECHLFRIKIDGVYYGVLTTNENCRRGYTSFFGAADG